MIRTTTTPHTVFSLLLACLLLVGGMTARAADDSLIANTDRYAFHSNFWINLHHFLYAQAGLPEDAKLPGGRLLSRAEWASMDQAIKWYREHFSGRSLLMDRELYAVKRALIGFGAEELPRHDAVSEELRAMLESTAPVYRTHYWPRHDHQNRALLNWNETLIRSLENGVLERIEALAGQSWPDGRIRVDLTWDANWAGAYCTTGPIHAVITSRLGGPENTWPPGGFLELLFHEPTHALIDPNNSRVARAIAAAVKELDVESPGQLWHGVLFYVAGSATREALATQDIDHSLLMIDGNIFARYHPALLAEMPAYLAGDADLDETMLRVVKHLQTTP